MSYAELECLLKQAMGLDPISIGSSAVERAVQARMSACAIGNLSDYAARARDSKAETQALIEAIVVPETWFFRDREAFAALTRIVQEEWRPAHPEGLLRLLSLPCSSGEEPYSMAMALLDARFPADRFRIDAVDISAHTLVRARRAHYGKNSFRGVELDFRERHFEATTHGHRLRKRVREQVQFHRANLLDPKLSTGAHTYDFIFCRNLLIYFDRPTQDRAVAVLQGLLAAQGVLFVGPSESGLLLNLDFVPARIPLAFAFRKKRQIVDAATVAPPVSSRHSAVKPKASPVVPATAARRSSRLVQTETRSDSSIEAAIQLADQGKLGEATRCCEAHLRRHGPSVQAFHLIGLIRAAAGELSEADKYYRKALYLDPNHYETLLHLALLLEKRGSRAGARVLRARMSRLSPQPASAHES